MFRFSLSSIIMTVIILLVTNSAMAAPQVLAVLSTGNGAAMECEGTMCSAGLSTYCLQRNREAPPSGTVYHAANTAQFSLVLDFADGSEKVVPVDGVVVFHSRRAFKAVTASVSRAFLDDHGASGVRLIVQAEASLVPEADPDDLNPLTESEIAQATGPLRNMGARVLDSREDADTARTLATILRAVPEWRGFPEPDYQGLWRRVSRVAAAEKIDPAGLERIEQEFGDCISVYQAGKSYGVGYCLMQRHDQVLLDLNKRYWETQAGS